MNVPYAPCFKASFGIKPRDVKAQSNQKIKI